MIMVKRNKTNQPTYHPKPQTNRIRNHTKSNRKLRYNNIQAPVRLVAWFYRSKGTSPRCHWHYSRSPHFDLHERCYPQVYPVHHDHDHDNHQHRHHTNNLHRIITRHTLRLNHTPTVSPTRTQDTRPFHRCNVVFAHRHLRHCFVRCWPPNAPSIHPQLHYVHCHSSLPSQMCPSPVLLTLLLLLLDTTLFFLLSFSSASVELGRQELKHTHGHWYNLTAPLYGLCAASGAAPPSG